MIKPSDAKILATKNDSTIEVIGPFSSSELLTRESEYQELSPQKFAFKYRNHLYTPAKIKNLNNNTELEIQVNFCSNPFCSNYGLKQEQFNVKNKPSRYKLVNANEHKFIQCTGHSGSNISSHPILNCNSVALSNWSVAEEIKRLTIINKTIYEDKKYNFHKDSCDQNDNNPFDNPSKFYKRGKNDANSTRVQCKVCKKITCIKATNRENFSYNQKKNDIIPLFIKLLLSHTPIKRTCEILDISSGTYYNKLEWVYRRCLEFLERHEVKPFATYQLPSIWVNTDKLTYNLNNVRRKGMGGSDYDDTIDKKMPIQVVASADRYSRYVFRADIAYDYLINQDDIKRDTKKIHCDHSSSYLRKNDRFGDAGYYPQPPTPNDTQTVIDYALEESRFNQRLQYVDGFRVGETYTTLAHLILLKETVKSKKYNFICDEDSSIITSISRVFSQNILAGNANIFLCRSDKNLSLKESYKESIEKRKELVQWGKQMGIEDEEIYDLAIKKLTYDLRYQDIFEYKVISGKSYPVAGRKLIEHPLPSVDEGIRYIGCINNLSNKSIDELAKSLIQVNNHAIDTFFNQIRRRLSILERPLVTARGDGKSYVYSNYNPKYAQYAITILRTFYNFCWEFKTYDDKSLTPAQRIGITDKKFNYKDILYFS